MSLSLEEYREHERRILERNTAIRLSRQCTNELVVPLNSHTDSTDIASGSKKLPFEIRVKIWKYTFPDPRDMDIAYCVESGGSLNGPDAPPVALLVCRESRSEALREYIIIHRPHKHEMPFCFSPSRDTFFLNAWHLHETPAGYDPHCYVNIHNAELWIKFLREQIPHFDQNKELKIRGEYEMDFTSVRNCLWDGFIEALAVLRVEGEIPPSRRGWGSLAPELRPYQII
ncbi:hypothetical protein B0J14DRAFT_636261 [Halenospora varia]|nr:hypothetical protein B0J14DRAFT_636261 [Halenospora varia]